MLPESKFPVTGGIMQTEEIVPRAQSTGLDDSSTDRTSSLQQPLGFAQHIQYSLPHFVDMAVKPEPQEEDERGRRTSSLNSETEVEETLAVPDDSLNHKRSVDQTNADYGRLKTQTAQQNGSKKSVSRARRKSRWKLKFHHQALPPEYLDHYEATLAQEAALNSPTAVVTESPVTSPVSSTPAPSFSQTPNPITDVQNWLQRFAAMQNETYVNPLHNRQMLTTSLCQTTAARRSVITSTQSTQPTSSPLLTFNHQKQTFSNHNSNRNNSQSQPTPRPPMKYSDLPYMGEITLDNSKPRRGRKPKKADICHLIYKNYGTILPGTPGLEERSKPPMAREQTDLKEEQIPVPFQRTDIQNRISSLLEKRLTQERRALEISADSVKEQDEPLNLCIRDLNLLKIQFNDKCNTTFGSFLTKSEGSSDADDVEYLGASNQNPADPDNMTESTSDTNNTDHRSIEISSRLLVNNNINHNINNNNNSSNNNNQLCSDSTEHDSNGADFLNNNDITMNQNPGLLYWPNTGVFIHPVALQSQFLYYQKMAQEKSLAESEQSSKEQHIVPKSSYSILENSKPAAAAPTAALSNDSLLPLEIPASIQSPRSKRNSTNQGQSSNQPIKRKRSAIFIPPMPTENNNNPATEVSICKFKFTGGAKPTLQEKKSLSVDSGGNFRYYSGTGDKSMRGYEFFPREALQQPANQPSGSSAGAFLSAAAERSPQPACPRPCSVQDESRRKRKTRKSIQREKLEQTFKEKGFLIQTQQLESAEGATYCKFRQLRKFTRYLFRSWKDYLPGNVRELTDSGEPISNLKDVEQDEDGLSASPSTPNNIDPQQNIFDNSLSSLPLN